MGIEEIFEAAMGAFEVAMNAIEVGGKIFEKMPYVILAALVVLVIAGVITMGQFVLGVVQQMIDALTPWQVDLLIIGVPSSIVVIIVIGWVIYSKRH